MFFPVLAVTADEKEQLVCTRGPGSDFTERARIMRIAARICQIEQEPNREQALFGAKRKSAEENLNQLRQKGGLAFFLRSLSPQHSVWHRQPK